MNTVEKKFSDVICAFKAGKTVIVIDDNDRENEGDLILSALHCTTQKMAFIIRYSSGIVCAAISEEIAKKLKLSPMVLNNDSMYTTAFTVTIDYRKGTTTGISANDRTLTVRNLANMKTKSSDFVRPGHIFPLIACNGGVLKRSGHTEAAIDLCSLSGVPKVGVLCELLNDDGSVMKGDQILKFAKNYGLHYITISDIAFYKQNQGDLLSLISEEKISTNFGSAKIFTYEVPWENTKHIAFVLGNISHKKNIPVFFHYENILQDIFFGQNFFNNILKEMYEKSKCGILLYIRKNINFIQNNNLELNRNNSWKLIGIGVQILKNFGVQSIICLNHKYKNYIGIEKFGIRIIKM